MWSEDPEKASELSLVEKQGIRGVGELSLFEGPDGRVLGLWKQGPKPA
jgi:hypothetical protein